jgi:hypothetical protein
MECWPWPWGSMPIKTKLYIAFGSICATVSASCILPGSWVYLDWRRPDLLGHRPWPSYARPRGAKRKHGRKAIVLRWPLPPSHVLALPRTTWARSQRPTGRGRTVSMISFVTSNNIKPRKVPGPKKNPKEKQCYSRRAAGALLKPKYGARRRLKSAKPPSGRKKKT